MKGIKFNSSTLKGISILLFLFALSVLKTDFCWAFPSGITYQGSLKQNGVPVSLHFVPPKSTVMLHQKRSS